MTYKCFKVTWLCFRLEPLQRILQKQKKLISLLELSL